MPPPSRPDSFPPPQANVLALRWPDTSLTTHSEARMAKRCRLNLAEAAMRKRLQCTRRSLRSTRATLRLPSEMELCSGKRRRECVSWQVKRSPIFEQFVHWIYSRRIDCGSDAEPFHILCRLWVLADRREVPLLMNECINTMRDKSSELWMAPAICLPYIYKNTMPGSAMRRLLIQLIARTSTSLLLERIDMDFSKEMLVDMLKVVWDLDASKRWTKIEVRKMRLCPEYHVHEDGVKCESNARSGTSAPCQDALHRAFGMYKILNEIRKHDRHK